MRKNLQKQIPGVNQTRFAEVPSVSKPRSSFDRSHTYKTTFDSGYLVPFLFEEVLPGDTFHLNATMLARMPDPLQVPVMDNMYLETFFFFVPNRLVWDNWEKFMGEQKNPDDSTDYLLPELLYGMESGDEATGTLMDYFGLPIPVDNDDSISVNALPFRAYNLIYNEWFRDQNLQDSVPVPLGDGPDYTVSPHSEIVYRLLRRNKRHDYFTSALPWPQKGPGVELPLGEFADVVIDPARAGEAGRIRMAQTGDFPTAQGNLNTSTADNDGVMYRDSYSAANHVFYDPNGTLVADLSGATAATINSFRMAYQLQRLLEADARGGSRYIEIIKSHFGVSSPDARLQRPEYLGGGHQRINVQPVPQTSASADQPTGQGHLSAFAVVANSRNGFSKSFVEHGMIIGLVNVRADITYQQGLERKWSRSTKYDFYWPALAHLGEQAVLNKEIYLDSLNQEQGEDVFGYQERFAEYRYSPSRITGKLRSGLPDTLNVWHLSQYFQNQPVLGDTFIQDNPPISRITQVLDQPQFVLDCAVSCRSIRPMPVYSVPGLTDRF